MRLSFILPEFVDHAGGGIVTFYRHYLPALVAAGHEVRAIVGSAVASGDPAPRTWQGVRVETLDAARIERWMPQFAGYALFPGLRRVLAAAWAAWEQADGGHGCDAVEACDWGLQFLPWVVRGGPPCVTQLHGSIGQIALHDPVAGEETLGHLVRLMEQAALARVGGAQAYSRSNAEFWRRRSGRDVQALLPSWRPIADPEARERSDRGLVIGRVQDWKGPQVLCEALGELGSSAPGIDWVGRDTPYGDRRHSTAAHLAAAYPGLWGEVVRHRPQVAFEAAAALQAQAAFVVVPSLWDTFNFTCVEAMAAGTPVICASGAGASELIEDGVNGFVFEAGRAGALAAALRRCLALSGPQRVALGEAARDTARRLDPARTVPPRIEAFRVLAARGALPPLPMDDWLRRAVEPRAGDADWRFLDHLPLRLLLGYVLRRAMARLRG